MTSSSITTSTSRSCIEKLFTVRFLLCVCGFVVTTIFIATIFEWPGSFRTYLLLTIAFNGLFVVAIKKKPSVGYLFLAVAMWIGFWLKISINLIFSTHWMEPVGGFEFTKDAYDQVAIVASTGAIGVLIAGLVNTYSPSKLSFASRAITQQGNRCFWIAGLLAVATLTLLNEKYQIVQAFRPPPVLDLPMGLQGLIGWYFGGGWGIILMIPLHNSFLSGRDLRALFLLVSAGVIISSTVYSRGILVFHALIVLLPLLVYSGSLPPLTLKRLMQYCGIIFLGVLVSVLIAMERRTSFFEELRSETSETPATAQIARPSGPGNWFYIAKLPIDRWIGLEGLMAVSSFEGKSFKLLIDRSLEPRTPGSVDFYTHNVALNPTADTKTVNYATPPSFIAFLYYSGSTWFVGVFSFFIAALLISSERMIFCISKNPFLSAAIGVGLTVQIIHMGTGGLSGPIKIFLTTFVTAAFLGWFQVRLSSAKQKLRHTTKLK